eukprot:4469886-Pyramimonas_sp.AAC.2
MHRVTRAQKVWAPTVVQSPPGAITSDPNRLLMGETVKLGEYWNASLSPPTAWVPGRECFPRATPTELRVAARSFSRDTSQSLDGFQARHCLPQRHGAGGPGATL